VNTTPRKLPSPRAPFVAVSNAQFLSRCGVICCRIRMVGASLCRREFVCLALALQLRRVRPFQAPIIEVRMRA